MSSSALIVFIKNSGDVKTRIANEKGKEIAISVYHELLSATFTLCQNVKEKIDIHLFFSSKNVDGHWHRISHYHWIQAEGDLGYRMQMAFEQTLKKYKKAVIIGSDCPYINADHIYDAMNALNVAEVVIGPALDGGYYMLGMNHFKPKLFEDIHWSSKEVYNQTCDRLFELRCTFSTLGRLSDIDYYEDYLTWKQTVND